MQIQTETLFENYVSENRRIGRKAKQLIKIEKEEVDWLYFCVTSGTF